MDSEPKRYDSQTQVMSLDEIRAALAACGASPEEQDRVTLPSPEPVDGE